MISKFKGLGVAMVTPFTSSNEIDYPATGRLIEHLIQGGVNYLVVLGTTGESVVLSDKEKRQLVSYVVERNNGRLPVVMGVGGNNTADVVDDLRSADFTGISAVLSVTPYYNKPTQEGLFQHYHALSQASPLPIILYNVPGRTGVNMTAETTLRIARSCKNVVAVKEASGNLDQIKAIIDGAPQGFHLISGDDGITTAVIQMGGIGVISVFGNAFPKEMAWLVESALKGNALDARNKMERDFNRLFHLIFVEGNPAGVKCILHLKGMIENILRLPLVPVSEKTMLEIKEELGRFS